MKYNERNGNVYLGKVCAQMYTMKTRGNEPTFSKNERKCAATAVQPGCVGTGRKPEHWFSHDAAHKYICHKQLCCLLPHLKYKTAFFLNLNFKSLTLIVSNLVASLWHCSGWYL